MRRKSKFSLVTILGLILVFIGVIVSFFYDEDGIMVSLIATLTAVIGAFAIYIQNRKSKLIGQSSFTIEISKYLYETPGLTEFIHKLGRASDVEGEPYVVTQKDRPLVIKYLNYIKTIAFLVDEKTVTIETLNNVFAYEFFIVVNNKSIQDLEIKDFAECYYDVFDLYDKWTKYLIKHKKKILHNKFALSNMSEYKKYFKEIK